jgi:Zn-dependent membrane protease YugP
MYLDPIYFFFAIPGLILGLLAQFLLKIAYGNYSKVSAKSGLTGQQAAELINQNEGFGVSFITTQGQLNDYYDSSKHLVNISSDNYSNGSVANIAVVAHEFGHVQQKMSGNTLFQFRNILVPVVNFGGNIGMILIMIGLGLGASALGLTTLGIILFASTTLFSLVTLPIEIDASRRGLNLIRKYNLIDSSQIDGAKLVLSAAAMTYFAGLISALGQLLYFVMLAQGQREKSS